MVSPRRPAASLAASPWAKARWLVLAPHADDETIGAGALIQEAAGDGRLAGVVFITDGAASHGPDKSRSLVSIRKAEARLALRRLAPRASPPVFLGWPDAAPPADDDAMFRNALARLRALCRALRVDAVAVTSAQDPHCDHKAACRLAYAFEASSPRPLRVFEYVVWSDEPMPATYRAFRTGAVRSSARRQALAAHRSQMTPFHGDGFRVPERLRRMPASGLVYLRASRHAP